MRTSYVVVASVVLGCALGAGVTWAKFHRSPPLVIEAPTTGPAPVAVDGRPKVLVDSLVHDFGAVEDGTKQVHVFKFTNLGDAPLTLKAGATTCTRCTITKLDKKVLEPGESTGVTVEYRPTMSLPKFRQNAAVITNDPESEVVELTVVGVVAQRFEVVPQYLVLSKISTTETKTADIKIYDYISDSIGVDEYEFTNKKWLDYFDAVVEPIPADQLGDPQAHSGCRVKVTVKPGLPVGPIRQTIRLQLKLADSQKRPVFEVPIEGTVDSDVSIVGRDWNPEVARLQLGAVNRSKGVKRTLFVMLRGPHRHETVITPATVDPPWMKVTVGEPKDLNVGAKAGVSQVPLTIEIPPGSPAVNRLGSDQADYGKILLDTTNPDAKQVKLYVQFVIVP